MRFDNVLVTGGAGRLGRYVVAELTGHCRVSVLDRDRRASRPDFPADVLDLDALVRAMRGHDAVVHLAAIDVSVPAPPEGIFDPNVRGTWNVLQAAQQPGGGPPPIRRAASASRFRCFVPTSIPKTSPGPSGSRSSSAGHPTRSCSSPPPTPSIPPRRSPTWKRCTARCPRSENPRPTTA